MEWFGYKCDIGLVNIGCGLIPVHLSCQFVVFECAEEMNLLENLTKRINGSYRVNCENEHSNNATTSVGGGSNGGFNNEQGQIELVEKILNQISLHQSSTMSQPTVPYHKSRPANQRTMRNGHYSKKVANDTAVAGYCEENSSNNHYMAKAKMNLVERQDPATSGQTGSGGGSSGQTEDKSCTQCEYYFINGQLVSKCECSTSGQSSYNRKTTMANNQVDKPSHKSGKMHNNRYKSNQWSGAIQSESVSASQSRPRQSIIQDNNCDVKNFVEAQVVFNQNNIDVVPVTSEICLPDTDEVEPDVESIKSEVASERLDVSPVVSVEKAASIDVKSVANLSPQAVKKIKCLIANFITIQVDDDSDELSQEDILNSIDFEKLGFQNFEGKNIGLYKNIGYINRNKSKFIQPTKELLNL